MRKLFDVTTSLSGDGEPPEARQEGGDFDPRAGDEPFRRALTEQLPAHYLADAEGRLIRSNSAFARVCELLLGCQAPRPGEPAPARLLRIFDRVRTTPTRVELTENVRGDEETHSYHSIHFSVQGTDGTVLGFGGVYVDVTQQAAANSRAAEMRQRYEDFLRSTSDWVWETDAELRLTAVSPQITAALGEPAPRLLGRPLSSLGNFGEPAEGRPAVTELIESRLPFRTQPFVIKNVDGETRHIHLSGVAVFDDETGRFLGYRGTGTDMTRQIVAENFARWARHELERTLEELKNQNAELDQALARLQAADATKSNFLAMISHELRTPLNAIIGFSEMATNETAGPLPSTYHGYAREVLAAGRHLLGLVNDLLDLTNIESGRLSVDLQPTALRTLIAEAWMQVSLRAKERGMELSRFTVDERIKVLADPVRARQIFLNLLSNAVKFGEEGGRIEIEGLPPADGYVETVVWNTGQGIPPEVRPKLFEGFHQEGHNAYTTGKSGMGLGLTLARRLARLMDGDVRLDHADDDGAARFVVRLPLAPEPEIRPADPAPPTPEAKPTRPDAPPPRPRARVTIVRLDDPETRPEPDETP